MHNATASVVGYRVPTSDVASHDLQVNIKRFVGNKLVSVAIEGRWVIVWGLFL